MTIMKSIIRSFALVFALGASVLTASAAHDPETGKAAGDFQSNVFKSKNATKFYCFVDKVVGKSLTITLRDENNRILNEQFVSKNATHVAQLIDLSQLEDGNYSLSISDANKMVVHPVRIATASAVKYIYVSEDAAPATK